MIDRNDLIAIKSSQQYVIPRRIYIYELTRIRDDELTWIGTNLSWFWNIELKISNTASIESGITTKEFSVIFPVCRCEGLTAYMKFDSLIVFYWSTTYLFCSSNLKVFWTNDRWFTPYINFNLIKWLARWTFPNDCSHSI